MSQLRLWPVNPQCCAGNLLVGRFDNYRNPPWLAKFKWPKTYLRDYTCERAFFLKSLLPCFFEKGGIERGHQKATFSTPVHEHVDTIGFLVRW